MMNYDDRTGKKPPVNFNQVQENEQAAAQANTGSQQYNNLKKYAAISYK